MIYDVDNLLVNDDINFYKLDDEAHISDIRQYLSFCAYLFHLA